MTYNELVFNSVEMSQPVSETSTEYKQIGNFQQVFNTFMAVHRDFNEFSQSSQNSLLAFHPKGQNNFS